MHGVLSQVAAIWLIGLVLACALMLVRLRSGAVRILLVDLVTMILVALLVLQAGAEDVVHLLDVALVVALLSFVGTLAAARFLGRGRLF